MHRENGDPQTGHRLSSVPENTACAWALYQFSSGWRMGAGARHVGNVTGGAGRPVGPAVNLYDAVAGCSTASCDFRSNIQHLANEAYVSWCRGLNQDCGYGERRNVLLTASYKF